MKSHIYVVLRRHTEKKGHPWGRCFPANSLNDVFETRYYAEKYMKETREDCVKNYGINGDLNPFCRERYLVKDFKIIKIKVC